jgi:hypothetical protein
MYFVDLLSDKGYRIRVARFSIDAIGGISSGLVFLPFE